MLRFRVERRTERLRELTVDLVGCTLGEDRTGDGSKNTDGGLSDNELGRHGVCFLLRGLIIPLVFSARKSENPGYGFSDRNYFFLAAATRRATSRA